MSERLTNHFDYCDFTECRHYDKELAKSDSCNFIHSSREHCLEYAVYNKLREYEDLEEQGLLLKLPCKVGDMVYLIFEKKVYQGNAVKVVSVRSRSHDFTRIEIVFEIEDPWYSDGRKMKHGANEILGERVFLTKEEAEEALRKKVDE